MSSAPFSRRTPTQMGHAFRREGEPSGWSPSRIGRGTEAGRAATDRDGSLLRRVHRSVDTQSRAGPSTCRGDQDGGAVVDLADGVRRWPGDDGHGPQPVAGIVLGLLRVGPRLVQAGHRDPCALTGCRKYGVFVLGSPVCFSHSKYPLVGTRHRRRGGLIVDRTVAVGALEDSAHLIGGSDVPRRRQRRPQRPARARTRASGRYRSESLLTVHTRALSVSSADDIRHDSKSWNLPNSGLRSASGDFVSVDREV